MQGCNPSTQEVYKRYSSPKRKEKKKKIMKIVFHKALAVSQWRKMIYSLPLLHIQHQSITMTCRFLRLSMGILQLITKFRGLIA